MKKSHGSIVGALFRKLAPRIGARVDIESEWGVAGQITYRSGKKRYFRFSSIDLNTLGASEIAKDKDYAQYFMKKLGYPCIPGKAFYSPEWARALKSKNSVSAACIYAEKMGYPVIVKPNSQSQGRAVALVQTKAELIRALRTVFLVDRIALVQREVKGKDYRIVVLDDRIISAYERTPLSVTGDGRHSIAQLLTIKQKEFVQSGRDTVIQKKDTRITTKLASQKLNLNSVIEKDRVVFLLDNANLSSGGDSKDVTECMHNEFKKIAVQLTKDMGLRLCGVDLMISGDITDPARKYWVIEINAAPGLDHYAASGKKQQKIVENLYLEVLEAMETA